MYKYDTPLAEITGNGPSPECGLSNPEVEARLSKYGHNILGEDKRKSPWRMIWNQLSDFMIFLLVIAAVISFVIGDELDGYVILFIVLINSITGFYQESKAEKAMASLKKMSVGSVHVVRNGALTNISVSHIVPGDIIYLEAGNVVPADIRLSEVFSFWTNEASLTGESEPVVKTEKDITTPNLPVADQQNMAFKGTHVVKGRAKGIVVGTGLNTELGKIARLLAEEEVKTPLQVRMTDFGKKLSLVIVSICLILFFIGLYRKLDVVELLLTSISLAVAAIPEALPAMISITLAIGARRMVKKKALVRNLPAVETLGSVTFICSDKTGTLTRNKMAVRKMFTSGEITDADEYRLQTSQQDPILLNMALNNDIRHSSKRKITGDPTEIALYHFAKVCSVDKFEEEKKYPRVGEIPFEAERKCMSTIHKTNDHYILYAKGATDAILNRTRLSDKEKKIWLDKTNEMASEGLRVIAFAHVELDRKVSLADVEKLEQNLFMDGLAGLMDPPRREAFTAIRECKSAGITPVMITGDHVLTAKAIATELKITDSDQDLILTGEELSTMTEDEFAGNIQKIKVYARVTPEQKLQIVKGLQQKGEFISMTGDGINDAPSLKRANVGVAMGITGTDVSKEAADIILLDDNFSTIVSAVKQGRKIYDNIRKFIRFVLTGNTGEIWTIFLAPLLGMPIPLLPIHILWINVVTDGLPGLALASEKPERDIMSRPPRKPDEIIFSDGLGWHILWVGMLIGLVCLSVHYYALQNAVTHSQTMVFTTLSFCQLAHVFAIRSERFFLFSKGLFTNMYVVYAVAVSFLFQMAIIYLPWLNGIFKTQPLSWQELLLTISAALIIFHAVELEKFFRNYSGKTK